MAHELMQFFTFEHLPVHLREVSEPFAKLARVVDDDSLRLSMAEDISGLIYDLLNTLVRHIPRNIERDECSRKLSRLRHLMFENPTQESVLRLLLEAKDCAVRAVLFKS